MTRKLTEEQEELQQRYVQLIKCYAIAEDALRELQQQETIAEQDMEAMDAEMDFIEVKFPEVEGAIE